MLCDVMCKFRGFIGELEQKLAVVFNSAISHDVNVLISTRMNISVVENIKKRDGTLVPDSVLYNP